MCVDTSTSTTSTFVSEPYNVFGLTWAIRHGRTLYNNSRRLEMVYALLAAGLLGNTCNQSKNDYLSDECCGNDAQAMVPETGFMGNLGTAPAEIQGTGFTWESLTEPNSMSGVFTGVQPAFKAGSEKTVGVGLLVESKVPTFGGMGDLDALLECDANWFPEDEKEVMDVSGAAHSVCVKHKQKGCQTFSSMTASFPDMLEFRESLLTKCADVLDQDGVLKCIAAGNCLVPLPSQSRKLSEQSLVMGRSPTKSYARDVVDSDQNKVDSCLRSWSLPSTVYTHEDATAGRIPSKMGGGHVSQYDLDCIYARFVLVGGTTRTGKHGIAMQKLFNVLKEAPDHRYYAGGAADPDWDTKGRKDMDWSLYYVPTGFMTPSDYVLVE
jgi:hypothetical protein